MDDSRGQNEALEVMLDQIYLEARARLERGESDPFSDLIRRHPELAGRIEDLALVHQAMAGCWDFWPATLLGGKYRVIAFLGRGGQAMVYRAIDTVLEREVAIKVLAKELFPTAPEVDRMLLEARALAALDHPHIVRVHEAALDGDGIAVVLELVRGRDLSQWIQDAGPLPTCFAVEIVRQVALALAAIHARGMTHRDVKPANILVDARDVTSPPFAKLSDLGLVSWKRLDPRIVPATAGRFVGTARYAAPEQRHCASEAGSEADVYSLGCVLLELLAGEADPTMPIAAGIAPPLRSILREMLSPHRQDRWTADQVARALAPLAWHADGIAPWIIAPTPAPLAASAVSMGAPVVAAAPAAATTWCGLEEVDRRALEQLAVFQGSFSLGAGESLLAGLEHEQGARDLIVRLLTRGLLGRPSLFPSRLALPDGLRDPAQKSAIERGSWLASQRLHLAGCLHWTLAVSQSMAVSGPSAARREVEDDLPNLEAALRFALESGATGVGLEMALQLAPALASLGRSRQGYAWILRFLRRERATIPWRQRQRSTLVITFLALAGERWRAARAACKRGLTSRGEAFDAHHLGALLTNLSIASRHLAGGQALAVDSCHFALQLLAASPHRVLEAAALESLGQALADRGELKEAALAFTRAYQNLQGKGGAMECVRIQLHRARLSYLQGQLDMARLEAQEARELARVRGLVLLEAAALNHLGAIALDQGSMPLALESFNEALRQFERGADRRGAATVWTNLGNAYWLEGDVALARAAFASSRDLFKILKVPPSTTLLLNEARFEIAANCFEAASERIEAVLARVRSVGDRLGLLSAVEAQSELAFARGQLAVSCRLAGIADAGRETMGAPRSLHLQSRLDAQLARAQQVLGDEAFRHAICEGRAQPLESQLPSSEGFES